MKANPFVMRRFSVACKELYEDVPTSSHGSLRLLYCGYGLSAWAIVPVKPGNGETTVKPSAFAEAMVVLLRVCVNSEPSGRYCKGIWSVNGPATPGPRRERPTLPL